MLALCISTAKNAELLGRNERAGEKTNQKCEQATGCPWGGLKNRVGSERGERFIWAHSRIRFVIFFYSRWKFRELIPNPRCKPAPEKALGQPGGQQCQAPEDRARGTK